MADSHIISFPGLGIGEYELFPTAFTLFGIEIKWYGIIITAGILLAFLYVLNRAKYERIKSDHIYDLAIFVIIFSIIGARLYYVLCNIKDYKSFTDIINIRQGGLAIYGGIIAGAIVVFAVSKIKKLDPRVLYDMIAPALILGQAIGRWGNFMNAEAYGYATALPWRMSIREVYSGYVTAPIEVHPTFLYESLWNLVGFIALTLFYKKRQYKGQIVLLYLTWYGLGRFWIEGLRSDSLYLWEGGPRTSQCVAALCFVFGLTALIVCSVMAKKKTPAAAPAKSEDGEALEIPAGQSPEFTPPVDAETHEIKDGMTAETLIGPGQTHPNAAAPKEEPLTTDPNKEEQE